MVNRNRVLSFMSGFGNRDNSPTSSNLQTQSKENASREEFPRMEASRDFPTPTGPMGVPRGDSPQPRVQRERASSRPMSMVQTYQPPLMDVNHDTLPELQPIFTFLNSHANKLYQEGYFLKLDDQNTHGRPNADRTWTECFAQLVGTVLSLWDAAELDAAGVDGEVLPKFINLTDASIKMIESLPTRAADEAPLQNVLSISTAGRNRYLLHFNSHHSLIQWTAGIRLAMLEHATLQEAYTGALIAGKGKQLNNINTIMEKLKMPTADWARVRFGAGTPWRRCWCVISPPDEKEVQKLQRQMKKKSAYDRSRPPVLKGDIKFYDSKKTKKVRPIATISDAYSAFAIYPQSKPLIDASTLVKVEGSITIHSNPPSTTEGFVFVMPEVHPAVTGFEIMLRWLFPVFDAFALYGRPGRLVAATEDVRSLMFAMPKHRRYGYLEILDVSGLILEPGSASWKESEWRSRLKELTGKRMLAMESSNRDSRYSGRRSTRNSFGPSRSRIHFDDGASVKSQPATSVGPNPIGEAYHEPLPRTDSAPPLAGSFTPPRGISKSHLRSASETHSPDRFQNRTPLSAYDGAHDMAPTPPPHASIAGQAPVASGLRQMQEYGSQDRVSSEDERPGRSTPIRELQELQVTTTPQPVAAPPKFAHAPGSLPPSKPYYSPELRRANSRMSTATLSQLAGASGAAAYREGSRTSEDLRRPNVGGHPRDAIERVHPYTQANVVRANTSGPNEGLVTATNQRSSLENSSTIPNPSAVRHADETATSVPQTSHVHPAPSILRKPLPSRNSGTETPISAGLSSSVGFFGQHVLDQSGFDKIGQNTKSYKPLPSPDFQRQNSGFSSIYNDDDSSTASPDYASTKRSMDTRESMERYRPDKGRAGVMKTVGDIALADTQQNAPEPVSPPIHIDFGPTINYARTPSPGPAKAYARANSPGPSMNNLGNDRLLPGGSPGRNKEQPYLSGHMHSSSDYPSSRLNYAEPRTVAWQPAMATAGSAEMQRAVTPEQFVQQRANAPLHVHQRQQSSNTLGRNTPTPPLVRNRSSEKLAQTSHSRNNSGTPLAQLSHSRNNSTDVLQRPHSRGPSVMLGSSGATTFSSSLSAREQEHLARATGQPLLNMSMNNNNKPLPQGGLVGAIDSREKEKQAVKQGMNSIAVQNAIAQRQQQAISQQQYPDPSSQDYRAQSAYDQMGQYPHPSAATNRGGHPYAVSAAGAFAQGGGWSTPTPPPNYPIQAEQGRQSPSFFAQQQQQYPPPPQQGGYARGSGNPGYPHGNGPEHYE